MTTQWTPEARLLAAFLYVSPWFGFFIVLPAVALRACRNHPFVVYHARRALRFQLLVIIGFAVAFIVAASAWRFAWSLWIGIYALFVTLTILGARAAWKGKPSITGT